VFRGFSDSTGENILNSLETVYLGDVYVQERRIAVIKFCVGYINVTIVDAVFRSSIGHLRGFFEGRGYACDV